MDDALVHRDERVEATVGEAKHLTVGNATQIRARDRLDLVADEELAESWGDVLVEKDVHQAA